MTPATTVLVTRVLKQREAIDRAALVAARQEQARREDAAAALAREIAREHDFIDAASLPPGLGLGEWREAAAQRLVGRQQAAAAAETACAAPQEALGDTIRLRRGFQTLCERRAEEAARQAERRDPLRELMLLPGFRNVSE